jgi:membrane-bound metal-dependent hydrolase YbcI (DUF457 family)
MPFPLGHTAIGLAAYETLESTDQRRSRWGTLLFITLLANLPDLDVVLGLLLQGNGSLFHRGPSHSLLFAILAGYAAARLGRVWGRIPRLGFPLCFSIVFSHVAADMLFTTTPVSLLWPFQLYWSTGISSWETVVQAVFYQGIQDGGIILSCALYLCTLRLMRAVFKGQRVRSVIARWHK